jgi:NAD-dependent dihydropyrimidine dehydrogenase PreA subunit
MMAFIVPVKSKTVTSDWTYFSCLVNRSINSICNQSNTNFKVIVSCHEIPETKFNDDSRVEFLKVGFSPPILKKNAADKWIKEADKGKKIKFAADYAMRIGASYVMTVDSDDCISNKICEFVCNKGNDSISGWYVKKGYLYPEGKRYLYLNLKNFHTLCGSCVIIKPELIDLMYGRNFWFDHERTIFENGLSLLPLPFPGSLYSMLNGTNIALDHQEMERRTIFNPFKLKSIKTLFRRLGKYRLIPMVFIKNEFAIYYV